MSHARTILHVAPHPDDETLGCGGSLLRHIAADDAVHWLVVTGPPHDLGRRQNDAEPSFEALLTTIATAYRFAGVHRLELPDARLDTLPLADLVAAIGDVIRTIKPSTVYVPHPGDAHSDHRVVFEATMPCTKWFRYPSVRRVLAYETPSETGFGFDPDRPAFRPTSYCDISGELERKVEMLRLYGAAVITDHPFPRSEEAVRALATLRGAECGCRAAEAFMVLRERW